MLGVILGVMALGFLALVLTLLGLIHIGYGRERQEQEVPTVEPHRQFPRIACFMTVEEKKKLGVGIQSQLRLFAIIDNVGEVAIRSLKGYWKVVTPDNLKYPSIKIQRDVLAPLDKYLESYVLGEGVDGDTETPRFDVEVEFDYLALNDEEARHYSGKFRFDRKSHRMVKIN